MTAGRFAHTPLAEPKTVVVADSPRGEHPRMVVMREQMPHFSDRAGLVCLGCSAAWNGRCRSGHPAMRGAREPMLVWQQA